MKKLLSLTTTLILIIVTICFCVACTQPESQQPESQSSIEILISYLKKQGPLEGYEKYGYSDYSLYSIKYDTTKKDIVFSYIILEDVTSSDIANGNYNYKNYGSHTKIYLDYKSQYSKVESTLFLTESTIYSMDANLNKSIFSKSNDTLYDIDIDGLLSYNHYDMVKSLLTSYVSSTLTYAEKLLEKSNINITLYDLGYLNY